MIQRNVGFALQTDGSVTPSVPQYGGVKGEHNVTKLTFTMNTAQTYEDGDLLRLSFCMGDGTVLSSDLLEAVSDETNHTAVLYWLPQTLTMAGGQLCMRLVVARMDEDGNEVEVFRSGEAVVYFEEAPVENGTPFWTGVSEMLKRTATAKDEAVTAQGKATSAQGAAVAAYRNAFEQRQQAEAARDEAVAAAREISQDIEAQNQRLQNVEGAVQSNTGMLNAASEYAKKLASDIEANAAAIRQNKQTCDDRAASTANVIYNVALQKLNNSGHEPDMFLGTDGNGNVVTKDAPSMDLPFTEIGSGFYTVNDGDDVELCLDEVFVADVIENYTTALRFVKSVKSLTGLSNQQPGREFDVYKVEENGQYYMHTEEGWYQLGGLSEDNINGLIAAQIQAYDTEAMALLGEDGDSE